LGASTNLFLALLNDRGADSLIIAHRGDSFHAPENTIEAARSAQQAGAPAWELDVQLTRDGVAIVLHDDSLLRTTDVAIRFKEDPRAGSGFRVADFDLAEVRTLDAGSWFVDPNGGPRSARWFGTLEKLEVSSIEHYRSGRVKIPTLAEALLLTLECDWFVNVEIKSFPDHREGLVEQVLQTIAHTGAGPRSLISSFDHSDVAYAANRPGREYAAGVLTSTPLYRTDTYAADHVGADTVHVSAEVLGSESIAYRRRPAGRSLRTDLISELKKRHMPILAYTVNDHGPDSLAEHMAQIGVDGLFTDDPHGLRRYFERGRAEEPGGPR
jgi:glycerophosphoryl diester phosphodiesterase